jgi:hypothetical protein
LYINHVQIRKPDLGHDDDESSRLGLL